MVHVEVKVQPLAPSCKCQGKYFILFTHIVRKMFVSSSGDLFFSEANRIRFVNSSGQLVTLAGSGIGACCGYVGGSKGDGSNSLASVTITGSNTVLPFGVNVVGFGDVIYFTDS